MSERIILNSIDKIDFDCNGVIEASAGTGKTYNITIMVSKLISLGIDYENLLILTFTEKATNELRYKIRQEIFQKSNYDEKLRKAYINFDRFNIYTIHGFCNYLIKNFPFDIGVNPDSDVTSIPRRKILRQLILREIEKPVKLFGQTIIEEGIELNEIENNVLQLLETYSKYKGHQILIESLDEKFDSPESILSYIENHRDEIKESGTFQAFLTYYFILRVKEIEEKYKEEYHLITYDDMIEKVWLSLNTNKRFLETLSKKFRYIIIDEFQDTDPIQWMIFEKLCFESSNQSKIFIVGDPKQAIYGFRGGDIHTYYRAKNKILENGGRLYLLKNNYRSSKKLVESLNYLFSSTYTNDGEKRVWFCEGEVTNDDDISLEAFIENVDGIYSDDFQPLNIFLVHAQKATEAQEKWRQFVVNEIKRILSIGIRLSEKNIKKSLALSDIMILCRTSDNAKEYEKILNKNGIRAKFFESEGTLLDGKEALNIKNLLYFLAFPEEISFMKKLFVSEIFSIPFEKLEDFINDENNYKELLEKWLYLSRKNKWGRLFDSVFYESGMFYRLIEEYGKEISSDVISKYLRISEILKERASEKNLEISALITEFEKMMEEERRKVAILDDEEYVKILTIHMSKGLEAGVVFIGDGFTTKNRYDFYRFYENDGYKYVIPSRENNSKYREKHKTEENFQNRRLYYVAFTRAKYSLYFPVGSIENRKGSGSWGIICKELKEWIESKQKLELKHLPFSRNEAIQNEVKPEKFTPEVKLIAGGLNINNRCSFIASFSSIKSTLETLSPEIILTEIEDESEAHSFSNEVSRESLLPPGTLTGTMLHGILEEIDFTKALNCENIKDFLNDREVDELIQKWLSRYFHNDRKIEDIKNFTASLIFNALKTKIDNKFSLSQIQMENRLSEVEFYYLLDNKNSNQRLLLTGSIDLLFEFEEKFYILDWKSNLLDAYERETVERLVEESYGLQYRIYTLATIEYLRKTYRDFDIAKFGGIIYLFLRGVNPDNNENGIFLKKIKEMDLIEFKNVVNEAYKNYIEVLTHYE